MVRQHGLSKLAINNDPIVKKFNEITKPTFDIVMAEINALIERMKVRDTLKQNQLYYSAKVAELHADVEKMLIKAKEVKVEKTAKVERNKIKLAALDKELADYNAELIECMENIFARRFDLLTPIFNSIVASQATFGKILQLPPLDIASTTSDMSRGRGGSSSFCGEGEIAEGDGEEADGGGGHSRVEDDDEPGSEGDKADGATATREINPFDEPTRPPSKSVTIREENENEDEDLSQRH